MSTSNEPKPLSIEQSGGPARRSSASRLVAQLLPSLRAAFFGAGKALFVCFAVVAIVFFGILLVLRAVNPPTSAVMLADRLTGYPVDQEWVPLDRISRHLVRAVIASEDARFCQHNGIDEQEFEAAVRRAKGRGLHALRGASTITMQVAKNLFLWQQRSFLRKGLEIPAALAIELVWPKRRILEVYLNIAEWGDGTYGAEAAAQYHFRRSSRFLTRRQAALLAVSLPNPNVRRPGRPGRGLARLARRIDYRARNIHRAYRCIYPSQRRRRK